MADRAGCKIDARISGLAVITCCVALLAFDFAVCACKGVARLGVVKCLLIDFCGLPVRRRVAGLAFRSEAALVMVFVAGNATGSETKVGAIEVFVAQERPRGRSNVLCVVAGPAGYT